MNKRNWFFGEVLDEAQVDGAFDNVEADLRSRALDGFSTGLVSGANVSAYAGDSNSFAVSPGIVIGPSGERIIIRDTGTPGTTGGYISVDSASVSTSPGSGNYRWVTIAVRYGRTLSDPEVDDLGNTVYTSITDSWNANGVTYANDTDVATNQATDGGYQIDNAGLSLNSFYVVAGPVATIGDPLSYPSLPSDAVILADVLYTDGDEGNVLDPSAISYARVQPSFRYSPSGAGYPLPSGALLQRRLLWEIESNVYKTRFFQSQYGLEITANAQWDPETLSWAPDTTTLQATRFTCRTNGFTFEMRFDTTAGTWSDANISNSGWDTYQELTNSTAQRQFSFGDFSGNMRGNGVQTGYVSLGMGSGNAATSAITSGQFPRRFTSTPSSVTTVSGGSETNVSSVSTTNLRTDGFDLVVTASSAAAFTARRFYTATQ